MPICASIIYVLHRNRFYTQKRCIWNISKEILVKRLFTKCRWLRKREKLGEASRDCQDLFILINLKRQEDGTITRAWKMLIMVIWETPRKKLWCLIDLAGVGGIYNPILLSYPLQVAKPIQWWNRWSNKPYGENSSLM